MKKHIVAAMAVVLCAGTPGLSDSPAPFPEFEAKRIKPPSSGSDKRRITVQIDSAEEVAAPVPTEEGDTTANPQARYGWFWDRVSPGLAEAGAGRLETAMGILAGSQQKVSAPRMQALQDIAKLRGIDILTATVDTKVSPALVLAVIAVESAGREDALSPAGAQGLMQLMPATAARFGVQNSFVARQNIVGGVKYLDWLMGEFDGDPLLVLAGYNAGEGAVRKHEGVPPFAETRDYVPKVLAAFQVARGLCMTPPVLASDGCVFATLN